MKKIKQRSIAAVLIVALLASTLSIVNIFAADTVTIDNHPALKGFTSGSAPASDVWEYYLKDYGDKPEIQISDSSFVAPTVTWDANDGVAEFSWPVVTGAEKYNINIYRDSVLTKSYKNCTESSFKTSQNNTLEAGKDYEVQIVAYDANGNQVSASCIRRFSSVATPRYKYVVQDFNDSSLTESDVAMRYRSATFKSLENGKYTIDLAGDYPYTIMKFDRINYALKDMSPNRSANYIYIKMNTTDGLTARLFPKFAVNSVTDSVEEGITYAAWSGNSNFIAPTSTGTAYIISASNPNDYETVDITLASKTYKTNYWSKNVAYYSDGYYLVIPLSVYSETVQKDIKAGTFNGFGLHWETGPMYYSTDSDTASYILNGTKKVYKNDTFAPTVEFDEVGFITDVNAWISQMKDELDPTAADQRTSYAYEGDLGTVKADSFDSDKDTLSNAKFDASYAFVNSNSMRRITFTAYSAYTNKEGMSVVFTAPEAGYYDLTNRLNVVNNSAVTDATVYYRVVKKAADGTETTVSPYDTSSGEWYGFNVSADNKNPEGNIYAPMVYLKSGEKILIQAYAQIIGGGQLDLDIGNPTATLVTATNNYKGYSYEWSFSKYVPHFVYDGKVNADNFDQVGRWTSYTLYIDPDTGAESYIDFNTHLGVNNMTSHKVLSNNGKTATNYGYYYYLDADTNAINEMKMDLGDNYGVSYQFTSPKDGSAVINFVPSTQVKYRISVNGTKVYPETDEWLTGKTISYAASVSQGDRVTIDVLRATTASKATTTITCVKSPKITMSQGNDANTVGDATYSPLWERPYNGRDYSGEFTPLSVSVWKFQTSDFTKTTAIASTDVNYYDSASKALYVKADDGTVENNTKYIFADEQLKFEVGTAKKGITLTYTAPELGYYDFSTAINILSGTNNEKSGAGDIAARITAGGKTVWPASGDWKEVKAIHVGDSIDVQAKEIHLKAGQTIVLQIYASTLVNVDGKDTPVPMVIGLGTPVVQALSNRTFTEIGNTTVYTPSTYTAFEEGYSGAFLALNSRFNFNFSGDAPISTDTNSRTLSLDSKNSVVYGEDGTLTLNIGADKTAAIEFISPMEGNGTFNITAAENSAVQYKLTKGNTVLSDWTSTLPASTDITAVNGDKFLLEIKATADTQVIFESFSYKLSGLHNNQNSATDAGYYASFAVPYANDRYIGGYCESDSGYWKFRLYDVENDKVVNANYYNYDSNKKLYNTNKQNAGYYFVENNNRMQADIYSSDTANYGLALGFEAPREATFNFRAGLKLSTANASATFMLRLIQNTTDKEGKEVTNTIWPAKSDSDGWYEGTIATGESISIPYAEFTFKEGDSAYLQIYAKDATANNLTVSLSSPCFIQDNVVTIEHVDVGARVYNPANYKPYAHFEVEGSEYTTTDYVPMENRWNFEYLDIDTETGDIIDTIYPDYYRIGSVHEVMFKGWNGKLWLNYQLGSSPASPKATARYLETNATEYTYKYVGSSKRFVAPSTAKYEITQVTPTVTGVIDGGQVRYRIVKISAADSSQTTIWPTAESTTSKWTDGSDNDWEVLDNNNLTSKAEELKIDLEVGDQLLFQMYNYVSKSDLDTYLTNANANRAEGVAEIVRWLADGVVNPKIIVYDFINESKSIHSLNTGWMANYQLSPFWRIQTADYDGGEYRDNTRYSWNYWLDSTYAYSGISSLQKWWFQNFEGKWSEGRVPIISARFTVLQDGYLTTSNTATTVGNGQKGYAKLRITLNGKTIYPEGGGWQLVGGGSNGLEKKTVTYDIKELEVMKGDVLRYELMYQDDNIYIQWNPALTINKYKDFYTKTDDIYNNLTETMLAHFKSLDATRGFGENDKAALALSLAIKARKAAAAARGTEFNQDTDTNININNNNTNNNNTVISGNTGDYREWTEEIYNPGGGYRKIIRRYYTPWWVYALIIGGCVLAAGGVTTLTIILVKKKRKKSAVKKNN